MSKLLIPGRVKTLEEAGMSKSEAIEQVAKEFDVSTNCVIAWVKRMPV